MFESIKAKIGEGAARAGELVSIGKDKVTDGVSTITQEVADKWHTFTHDVLLVIVLVLIGILLVMTVFDFIRKLIRGLDIAAIGVLFCWVGSKIPEVILINELIKPAWLIGLGLIVVGILIFLLLNILPRMRKHKRNKREAVSEV